MKVKTGQLFAIKVSFSFIAQFWGVAGFTVFFAAWLAFKGLDGLQIAIILGVSQFFKAVFGPVGALFADGFRYKKTPILYMNLFGLFSVLFLFVVDGYWAIMVVTILYSISIAAIMPILDGLAMQGATIYKFDYGRTRLWGSLGFMVAAILCGIIVENLGLDALVYWLLFAAVFMLVCGSFLPVLPEVTLEDAPSNDIKKPKFDMAGATNLIKNPVFITILVTISFILSSHAVYYGFSTIHWHKIGYSSDIIGFLWAVGVVAEVIFFAFSNKIMANFGPRRLLILGAIAAIIRWGVIAYDPPIYVLFAAQTLHAFTFAATYLGSLHLINKSVPSHLISTAMAISASLNAGIFMSIAMFLGGLLYNDYANWAYLFAALLGVIGLVMALGLKYIWNGDALTFGDGKTKG